MKILLLYPPGMNIPGDVYFAAPPLGLAYIAAVLQKNGHTVKIVDSQIESEEITKRDDGYLHIGMPWHDIKAEISNFGPDIVGISNLFSIQFPNVQRLAKISKEIKNIPVVIGGAHPSALPNEVLVDPNIDFAVIGEGEYTFNALVNCLQNKTSYANIDGLAFKNNNKVIINPKTKYVENLDELPFPARDLLPMQKYFTTDNPHSRSLNNKLFTTVVTSRGCPSHCVFCSIHTVWGFKWRARSPKNVLDEIELLVKQYNIKEIQFEDDNISLNHQRMMEICQGIIDRKLDIKWCTPNGIAIQTLDEKLLIKMQESGCYHLCLAVESANQHVLHDLIGKGLNLKKVENIMSVIKKIKMKNSAFFVFGVPGETKETIYDSINFAKKMDFDDAWFSMAMPYPGTALYDNVYKNNYIDKNNINKFWSKYAVISTPWLSSAQLENLRNRAYLEFQISKMLKHPFSYLTKIENYKTWKRYIKYFVLNYLNINKLIKK